MSDHVCTNPSERFTDRRGVERCGLCDLPVAPPDRPVPVDAPAVDDKARNEAIDWGLEFCEQRGWKLGDALGDAFDAGVRAAWDAALAATRPDVDAAARRVLAATGGALTADEAEFYARAALGEGEPDA